jgi:hypothetical protein
MSEMTVDDIKLLVLEADPEAKHYWHTKSGNYTVWAEYELGSFYGDNRAHGWRFTVKRVTNGEDDPVPRQIQSVLDANMIPYLYQVEVDEEARTVTHLFDCEAS